MPKRMRTICNHYAHKVENGTCPAGNILPKTNDRRRLNAARRVYCSIRPTVTRSLFVDVFCVQSGHRNMNGRNVYAIRVNLTISRNGQQPIPTKPVVFDRWVATVLKLDRGKSFFEIKIKFIKLYKVKKLP